MKHCVASLAVVLLASVALAADQPAKVKQIKVQPDKAADCSSVKSIVESITRGAKSNDEKAIAIHNFMVITHYHLQYPNEGKEKIAALKSINVYGWALCGGLHTVQGAMYRELGWNWRYVGWNNPGHTTIETEYDGRWHYLDSFLKFYAWMPDPKDPAKRIIAGEQDLKANPALVTDAFVLDDARKVYYMKDNRFQLIDGKANWTAPVFLTCGDPLTGVVSGTKTCNVAGSAKEWGVTKFDEDGYSTDVNLAPGYALTLTWDAIENAWYYGGSKKAPVHSCGDKDYRNDPSSGPIHEPYRDVNPKRSYSNGKLAFTADLSSDAVLKSLAAVDNVKWEGGALLPADAAKAASVTVELQSPYPMSKAAAQAEVDSAELSVDGGKTWKKVQAADFSAEILGRYAALLKLSFTKPLKALSVEAVVECNRGALPYLSPGKNKVAVSVADPKALGDSKLVVTYAYKLGSRSRSFDQLVESGHEVAKGHSAKWSDKVTVVQKTFTAAELPATIEIDVPTPKGAQPVYPRMMFMRREVVSPGGKPLATVDGAVEAKVGADEELKELPNPFAIGWPSAKPAPTAKAAN